MAITAAVGLPGEFFKSSPSPGEFRGAAVNEVGTGTDAGKVKCTQGGISGETGFVPYVDEGGTAPGSGDYFQAVRYW